MVLGSKIYQDCALVPSAKWRLILFSLELDVSERSILGWSVGSTFWHLNMLGWPSGRKWEAYILVSFMYDTFWAHEMNESTPIYYGGLPETTLHILFHSSRDIKAEA